MNTRYKHILIFVSKLIISFGLIIYAFYFIDVDLFFNALKRIDTFLFVLISIIAIIQIGIISEGLKNIFLFLTIDFGSRYELVKANFKSTVYLLAFPGFSAPDVYLTAYFSQKKNSIKKVIFGLFLNRIAGFAIFLLISTITFFIMFRKILDIYSIDSKDFLLQIAIPAVFVFLCFCVFVFLWKMIISPKMNFFKTNLEMLKSKWTARKQYIIYFFLIKTTWYFFSIFSRVFLAKFIGVDIHLLELITIIICVNFLIAMPISVSGVGVREVSFVSLLGLFGVSAEKALLLSCLDFGIILVAVFIGIFIILTDRIHDLKNFFGKE